MYAKKQNKRYTITEAEKKAIRQEDMIFTATA